MRLASTWPVSTAERAIAMVRNRSMMPAGHVHGDHDGGALDGGGDGHEQDARGDVVEVAGTPGVAAGQPRR